jgi:hypothetical protein
MSSYKYAVGRYRMAHGRFVSYAAERSPADLPPRMLEPIVWIRARNKARALELFKKHKRLLLRIWRDQQVEPQQVLLEAA